MPRRRGRLSLISLLIFSLLIFCLPTYLFANANSQATAAGQSQGAISVKDFGAKGDGVSNDAPSFIAAMKKAASSVNKTVNIPPGTYNGDPGGTRISVPPNVTIVGAGINATVLNNIGFYIYTTNVTIEHLSNQGTTQSIFPVYISEGASNTYINDVSVSNATGPTAGFVVSTHKASVLQGLVFKDDTANNIYGFGFLFIGIQKDYKNNPTLIENVKLINDKAIRCGYSGHINDWVTGFDLDHGMNYSNIQFIDDEASYNWESGFHQEAAPTFTNVTYENCISHDNGQKPQAMFGDGFLGSVKYFVLLSPTNVNATSPSLGRRLIAEAESDPSYEPGQSTF